MKKCSKCGEEKELTEFRKRKRSLDGLQHYCKSCQNRTRDDLARASPTYARNKHLKQTYGITIEQYDRMLEGQNYKCYVCEAHVDTVYKGQLYVDHDHTTGSVRKLLCHNCNSALGYAKEDTEVLSRLIAYIKEHNG